MKNLVTKQSEENTNRVQVRSYLEYQPLSPSPLFVPCEIVLGMEEVSISNTGHASFCQSHLFPDLNPAHEQ